MTAITAETLSPILHNQIPVITTELLAQLYGTDTDNIKKNYSRNQNRFVLGKHFFKLEGAELKEFKNRVTLSHSVDRSPDDIELVAKHTRSLILWTERGAARHAKMLETDQAWEVFEKLEDSYFCQKAVIDNTHEINDIIQGDGHSLLIHFDEHHQISFTEKVPADAIVATVDKVKWWMEQNGWLVMRRDNLTSMTLQDFFQLGHSDKLPHLE